MREKPLIDLFICTYNEEESILERTIIGATGMDYPNYRVWVLDDGKSSLAAGFVRSARLRLYRSARQCPREGGQYQLRVGESRATAEAARIISILDADFVPMPDFLSRAMTLFRDERIGIVQTPQHFINPDPIQTNLLARRCGRTNKDFSSIS